MKNTNTKTLTRVALLVAIELVMKLVGLGSVPVGPLYRKFEITKCGKKKICVLDVYML